MSTRKLTLIVLVVALAAPAATWAFFKPVRIFAPELNGVSCRERVCVEDETLFPLARQLQQDAMAQVAMKLLPLKQPPLTVFCSTRECYHAFGGGMERGAALFNWGVILAPESWVSYIVEHEYIHMLQAQELGLWGRRQ